MAPAHPRVDAASHSHGCDRRAPRCSVRRL